ncbi:hypothetical protein L228DRAFT_270311 [Xylona heveae TC161]|uniref:Uncharacterized protein n=1 Tax=Xylona heveae (strain CBS 132557 / TC161) TaxID=1328760 RepID=A0A165ABN2_XYLHT|nr:hypothetical protein L228DRAFT_270311 [Xylona heveae TC161]KZF20220.1 hypothetical protein L228DRAFT_270311 [Xylona heveae TC161]
MPGIFPPFGFTNFFNLRDGPTTFRTTDWRGRTSVVTDYSKIASRIISQAKASLGPSKYSSLYLTPAENLTSTRTLHPDYPSTYPPERLGALLRLSHNTDIPNRPSAPPPSFSRSHHCLVSISHVLLLSLAFSLVVVFFLFVIGYWAVIAERGAKQLQKVQLEQYHQDRIREARLLWEQFNPQHGGASYGTRRDKDSSRNSVEYPPSSADPQRAGSAEQRNRDEEKLDQGLRHRASTKRDLNSWGSWESWEKVLQADRNKSHRQQRDWGFDASQNPQNLHNSQKHRGEREEDQSQNAHDQEEDAFRRLYRKWIKSGRPAVKGLQGNTSDSNPAFGDWAASAQTRTPPQPFQPPASEIRSGTGSVPRTSSTWATVTDITDVTDLLDAQYPDIKPLKESQDLKNAKNSDTDDPVAWSRKIGSWIE